MKKRTFSVKNFMIMILANVVIGLGVAFFKLSLMGNDPSTALVMAIGAKIGLDFSIVLIFYNLLCFIAELIWGRHYIGAGTIANWFLCGISASFFIRILTAIIGDTFLLPIRFILMLIGVLVISPAVSAYQTANMGIAPYDALSIMMNDHLPIPYFWCRMTTDIICAAVAYSFGGIIGLGTIVCAFGLGPIISFFNPFMEKLYD